MKSEHNWPSSGPAAAKSHFIAESHFTAESHVRAESHGSSCVSKSSLLEEHPIAGNQAQVEHHNPRGMNAMEQATFASIQFYNHASSLSCVEGPRGGLHISRTYAGCIGEHGTQFISADFISLVI